MDLEPSPGTQVREFILEWVLEHHTLTPIFTYIDLAIADALICMLLDSGRKLENQEETHMNTENNIKL